MTAPEDTADFPPPVIDIPATVTALVEELDKRTHNGAEHRTIIREPLPEPLNAYRPIC